VAVVSVWSASPLGEGWAGATIRQTVDGSEKLLYSEKSDYAGISSKKVQKELRQTLRRSEASWLAIHGVKWRHSIYGHDTIAILWV